MADKLWNSLYTGPVYLTERQASKLPWWEWKAPGPGRIRLYHFTRKEDISRSCAVVRCRSQDRYSLRRRDHGTNATINFSLQEIRGQQAGPQCMGRRQHVFDEHHARHSHAPLHCPTSLERQRSKVAGISATCGVVSWVRDARRSSGAGPTKEMGLRPGTDSRMISRWFRPDATLNARYQK